MTVWAFAFASGPGRSVAADLYVATNGTGDGSSWPNAMGSIQGAIDSISEIYRTNTVWVSNGVYEVGGVTNYPTGRVLTNRVAIYKAITVRSANNDPTNTVIKGAWASDGNTSGVDAVRCVYMTNGSTLIGFMVTNGATLTYVASDTDDHRGGGLWCQSTNAIISNCVIAGNAASLYGSGTYIGSLYNCTLIGNSGGAQSYGGGTYNGRAYSCTFIANVARYGGGMAYEYAYNCMLSGNTARVYGGGEYGGVLYNCTIVGNSSISGEGGGVRNSTLYNCISWGNNRVDSQQMAYYSCGVEYTNGGSLSGNITNNPQFIDAANNNYRLLASSPCINTGTNQAWMTDGVDLDNRPRIRYRWVDMGAYEHINRGTIYSF